MNLTISSKFINDWCKANFKDYRLQSGGRELVVNSFLVKDVRKHLSINLITGLWQDFKCGEVGDFIKLYALKNQYSYQYAKQKLLVTHLDAFTWDTPDSIKPEPPKKIQVGQLTPITLKSGWSKDFMEVKAWSYLFGRRLFNSERPEQTHFYLSNDPRLQNRIVIPFFHGQEIFYYQARAIDDTQPKYLNPKGEESGVKTSDVLFPFDDFAESVVVCEGPLDAITLQNHGVNATCTMGSRVSRAQGEILRDFRGRIIIGYDNDKAGNEGAAKFNILRKQLLIPTIYRCPILADFKDWNEAAIFKHDLKFWVESETKEQNWFFEATSALNTIL